MLSSENKEKPLYVKPVLYPSGTDFRTRMPTERRLDCTLGGRGGVMLDSGDVKERGMDEGEVMV